MTKNPFVLATIPFLAITLVAGFTVTMLQGADIIESPLDADQGAALVQADRLGVRGGLPIRRFIDHDACVTCYAWGQTLSCVDGCTLNTAEAPNE